MRTKLSLFCEELIEAAWLTAAVAVPVLFNVLSAKVFEVDKVALVRSLALLMALAWVVYRSESGIRQSPDQPEGGLRARLAAFFARPLILPALGLLAVHALATAASVWPHGSLWGTYERRQGLFATLSYAVIFLLTSRHLRWRSQLDRIVGLVVLTSIPISLYALAQRFGLDPVSWAEDLSLRVASTLGNPIFTAGYLIMVLPLALGQAVRAVSHVQGHDGQRRARIGEAAFYGAVVLLHLLAIVLTQSRGPLMGLLSGLFFFALVWAVVRRKTRWVLVVIAVAAVAGCLLVVLNLPQTPLSAVKTWPYVGRLTTIRGDPSLQSRALMWQNGLRMATAHPLRTVIGYGPESARVASYPYITPELADLIGETMTTSRLHNETMDALVGTGIVGLLAYLALFGSVFAQGLRSLGVISSAREMRRFAAALIVGALLGGVSSWLLVGGLRLIALTLPSGMLLAMVAYLVIFSVREPGDGAPAGPQPTLRIALFSALVAHFVEIQTGIAVTATRTQFWLYAAVVAAIAAGVAESPAPDRAPDWTPSQGRRPRRKGARGAPLEHRPRLVAASVYASGVGLLLVVLGFDFFTPSFAFRPEDVAMVGLLLLVWLLGGVVAVLETSRGFSTEDGPSGQGGVVLIYGTVSLGLFGLFLPFHIAATNAVGDSTSVVTVLYLFLLVGVVALGFALVQAALQRQSLPRRFWRRDRWWLYPLLSLPVAFLVWRGNLAMVRADMVFQRAQAYQVAGQLDRSIELYGRAVDLLPRQHHYYPFLGQAYLRKAIQGHEGWFERTEEAFEQAMRLNPLKPDHYANLGLLHFHWGQMTSDPAQAAERLEAALSYYERAAAMSPYTHGRLLEENRLRTHLQLADVYGAQGSVDRAIEELRAAVELAPPERKAELERRIAEIRARQVGYWADVAPNCRVDAADVQLVADRWRCGEGRACYQAAHDRDADATITVIDVMRVVAEWGWTCP